MFARLHSLSAASRDTFWRSLQALGATRIVIAIVLIVVAWRLHSVRLPQLEQIDVDPIGDSPRAPTRPGAPAAAA